MIHAKVKLLLTSVLEASREGKIYIRAGKWNKPTKNKSIKLKLNHCSNCGGVNDREDVSEDIEIYEKIIII